LICEKVFSLPYGAVYGVRVYPGNYTRISAYGVGYKK